MSDGYMSCDSARCHGHVPSWRLYKDGNTVTAYCDRCGETRKLEIESYEKQ